MDHSASEVFPMMKLRADLASTGIAESCQHWIVEDPLTDARAEIFRGGESLMTCAARVAIVQTFSASFIFHDILQFAMNR